MKRLQQLLQRLGGSPTDTPSGGPATVEQFIAAGQQARRADHDAEALAAFDAALALAETSADSATSAHINRLRAETLINLNRLPEAEMILLGLRRTAQVTGRRPLMAAVLTTLGILATARHETNEARAFFEQAVQVSRAGGGAAAEATASAHLARLYLDEGNASYAAHLLRQVVVDTQQTSDPETISFATGMLGQALVASSEEATGERLLLRALRAAEAGSIYRLERRWALALAERALVGLRYEEAFRYLTQALERFPTDGDPAARATVLCQLSRVCLYLQQVEEGLAHAQHAAEIAPPDLPPVAAAHIAGALGMALRAAGRPTEAIPHLDRALEIYDDDHPAHTEILRALAAARAADGDPAGAAEAYGRAAEAAAAQDRPADEARAHQELGLVLADQGRKQEAMNAWRRALALYESVSDHAQVARLHCDIAAARRFLGQSTLALKEYEHALMYLSSVEDWATRGIVLANAANMYAEQGDIESAEAFYEEAIGIAARLKDPVAEATRRGNYGWLKLMTGRPHEALLIIESALKLSQARGLNRQAAVQLDNLGLAHDALGNRAAALTYHRQALDEIRALGDPHWTAIISLNLARSLLDAGEVTEAAGLVDAAMAHGRSAEDIEVLTLALALTGAVALRGGRPGEAQAPVDEAMAMARRAGLRHRLAEALALASEARAAMGDHNAAVALWDEARHLYSILHMPHARLRPAWLIEGAAG